jgi:hypothetical protein
MLVHHHAFVNAEVSLIVEALQRTAKRQKSLAKWHSTKNNKKLRREHDRKARAMQRLIAKLQPMTGLKGTVKL